MEGSSPGAASAEMGWRIALAWRRYGTNTRLDGVSQLLLLDRLNSNAASRMSPMTIGAMPRGVCAVMRERDG